MCSANKIGEEKTQRWSYFVYVVEFDLFDEFRRKKISPKDPALVRLHIIKKKEEEKEWELEQDRSVTGEIRRFFWVQ